ncbi:MAG: hypothetical protein ACRCWG_15505 [Sarcina sp.]
MTCKKEKEIIKLLKGIKNKDRLDSIYILTLKMNIKERHNSK